MHTFYSPSAHLQKVTKSRVADSLLVVSCILGFLLRAYTAFIFPEFTADEHVQLVSARLLAEGHGISSGRVSPDDLASPVFEPLDLWPPGYAVVAAPLLQLGFSPFTVSRLTDLLGWAVFFLAWLLLFRQVKEIGRGVPILFFLLAGLSYAPYRLLGSTDILSLAFSFLAFSMICWFYPATGKREEPPSSWILAFLLGVCFFLPSFFRFAYYPVSIMFPLMLLYFAWQFRRPLLPMAFLTLIITLILLGSQQLYQFMVGQSLTYLSSHHPASGRWFFPENLLNFDPILVSTLFPEFLIQNKIGAGAAFVFNLIITVKVGMVLALAYRQLLQRVQANVSLSRLPNALEMVLLGISWIGEGVILFLVLMSLFLPPLPAEWVPGGLWTYVRETRYFAVILVFLPLVLLLVALEQYFKLERIWVWTARVLLLGSVSVSLVFFVYHLHRYSFTDGIANMRRYYGKSHELAKFLQQQQISQSPLPVVYLFSQESLSFEPLLFQIEGAAALPVWEIKGPLLKTTAPVRLLFSIYPTLADPDNLKVKGMAERYGATKVAEIPDLGMEIWETTIK